MARKFELWKYNNSEIVMKCKISETKGRQYTGIQQFCNSEISDI